MKGKIRPERDCPYENPTGSVKVKVDATRRGVEIGDLLVTDEIPGRAIRSEAVEIGGIKMRSSGTILGKAFEALEAGRGEILVLFCLQ